MSSFIYSPLPPPQDIEGLPRYLQNELGRIGQAIIIMSTSSASQLYLATPPVALGPIPPDTPTTVDVYDSSTLDDASVSSIANGTITTAFPGVYTFNFSATLSADTNNVTLTFKFSTNGVPTAGAGLQVYLPVAGEPVAVSFTAVVNIARGAVLDIEVEHSEINDKTLTFIACAFSLTGKQLG